MPRKSAYSDMPPIIIDTREQLPYTFKHPTIRRGLPSGDYSLEGYESRVAVERKSKADLFGSCGKGRVRFEKEFKRLAEFQVAALVIESTMSGLNQKPTHVKKMKASSVYSTVVSWSVRYGVLPLFAEDRRYGAATTLTLLRMFWRMVRDEK